MTIRHFQIFKVLCEELNMTRTAEKLFMTQPSVSQAIAELETHYQTKLLDRLGKKLYLTESGAELLTRVSDILAQIQDTENVFQEKNQRRRIRLGATATVGSFVLPTLLRNIHKWDADLEIEFLVGNTAQVEKALLHAELDIALIEGRTTSRLLLRQFVLKDPLVLVAHPSLLQGNQTYKPKDLEKFSFLLREEGSGTAEQALNALANWGIEPHIAGRISSIEALHRLVLAKEGLAFLPRIAVDADLKKGKLAEIHVAKTQIERSFWIVYHASKKMEGDLLIVKECMAALSNSRP